jgi:hypothetical protein
MDSWREELQCAIAQGLEDLEDEHDEQLMEDIFFALEEPYLEQERPQIGSSWPGRRLVHRDREAWNERLFKNYFAEDSTFDAMKFRQRYRMRRELFLHLVDAVFSFDP